MICLSLHQDLVNNYFHQIRFAEFVKRFFNRKPGGPRGRVPLGIPRYLSTYTYMHGYDHTWVWDAGRVSERAAGHRAGTNFKLPVGT